MSTDVKIDFEVEFFTEGDVTSLYTKTNEYGNELENILNLYNTKTITNMHLFDRYQKIKHYKTIEEIMDDYYAIRYEFYEKRKEKLIEELKYIVMVLKNKARFIKEQCDDLLDLRRKKMDVISKLLKERKYDMIDEDKNYGYLVNMPMSSIIEENIEKLEKEKMKRIKELENLTGTSISEMWLHELDNLKTALSKKKIKLVKSP